MEVRCFDFYKEVTATKRNYHNFEKSLQLFPPSTDAKHVLIFFKKSVVSVCGALLFIKIDQ